MTAVVSAKNLSKYYGDFCVLKNLDLNISTGQIVGLIGPNGAGKTTALRCLLGLSTYQGYLNVLGKEPQHNRINLLQDVAYIADTAILPAWISVEQTLEYMEATHRKFNRAKAHSFLDKTDIHPNQKVKQLSKGMVTQLHLALTVSIDAKFLVLDEPTLGLDILYRKRFYEQLLNDYFDDNRTILITTHQVEEIEQLLTDLIFIQQGKIVLNTSMESLTDTFIEVEVSSDKIQQAKSLNPIHERTVLGGVAMMFESCHKDQLTSLGKIRVPSIADIFVAKMGDNA